MAMGITLAENRLDLTGDRLFVEDRQLELGQSPGGPDRDPCGDGPPVARVD